MYGRYTIHYEEAKIAERFDVFVYVFANSTTRSACPEGSASTSMAVPCGATASGATKILAP